VDGAEHEVEGISGQKLFRFHGVHMGLSDFHAAAQKDFSAEFFLCRFEFLKIFPGIELPSRPGASANVKVVGDGNFVQSQKNRRLHDFLQGRNGIGRIAGMKVKIRLVHKFLRILFKNNFLALFYHRKRFLITHILLFAIFLRKFVSF
jgi:hypothetical protein